VNLMDISQLALNVRGTLTDFVSGGSRQVPITITYQGEPLVTMIRAEVYAPRLDRFAATYDEGYRCLDCESAGQEWTTGRLGDLAQLCRAANEHWRDTHRERK
jgi:hypothetical protein